ncbi:hypothetical protein KX729_05055 [Rhizobium sp. XQZ8]|uniref:hypothetical protein n=1 Tax=Rhizobium populisoli TaxID=2859785 RepID=UPI001CA494CC|nr:hypothetical protein [Rhizobium populisoli]MBW6420803.1 hypothetical protein [Rhizobium populisoli]
MSKSFDRVRGYVYPRAVNFDARDSARASTVILGMLGVMWVVILIAQVIMLIAG